MNDKEIPIFIMSRDRVTYLKMLCEALTKRGHHNIHIVDNKSSYPPLLEWLDTCGFQVHRMDRNYTNIVFVESKILDPYYKDYYAYTDNDIVPDESCPDDFMTHFRQIMERYPNHHKVGFGLRIDDLPDYSQTAVRARSWESQFWKVPCEPGVFVAAIDTTFALCRPGAKHLNPPALRTGPPYVARHMPWYENHDQCADDVRYYVQHSEMPTNWNPPKI